MRKASFESTFNNFYQDLDYDIGLLMKIEGAKQVVKSRYDKGSVFEAFVHSACATWQIFFENLLIDCLNKDSSQYTKHTDIQLPKHLPRETCKAILIGTGYLDIKSVDNLQKEAKKILIPDCNPFKEIPKLNKKKIDEMFTIRNFLSHYSDYARRPLQKVYNNYGYTTFRRPGTFLLVKDEYNKEKLPRLGIYINILIDTADIMAKFLNVSIEEP